MNEIHDAAYDATMEEAASQVADAVYIVNVDPFISSDAARHTMVVGIILACAETFEHCALALGAFYAEQEGRRFLAIPTTLDAETVGKAHGFSQSYANALTLARIVDKKADEALRLSFNPNCLH